MLLPVTIQSIQELAKGYKTFSFAEGHSIAYQSGQYLTFVHQMGHDEIRRSYSITSSPVLNEPLSIGVKRVENGLFSRYLFDNLKVGDRLFTTGAAGFFTLPPEAHQLDQVFFFAAGSGITPVFSLLKTLLYTYDGPQAVLVYSNPSEGHTLFRAELIHLEEEFPGRLNVLFLNSDHPDLFRARLSRELLALLLDQLDLGHAANQYYICGPEAYMRMVGYTLQERRIDRQRIRREHFISRILPAATKPPDTKNHTVLIHTSTESHQIEVRYPESILAAAKRVGLSLPYSCEAGICGNCAARLLKGEVWLSANDVLTDQDLHSGLTLTCTGHPLGGDVEIQIP